MRRFGSLLVAALVAIPLVLAPALAEARAGGGYSFGSRGSHTYSAPPSTRTAPYAAPMQRSLTPRSNPAYGNYGRQGYGSSGFGRSPFVSGLLGGLIGAGIGGLLFGRGFLHGISGFGGFLGLLLQIFIIVMILRWLFRRFFTPQPAVNGPGMFGGLFARGVTPPGAMAGGGGMAGTPGGQPVPIGPADYQAFEATLRNVQAAWTTQDLNALRGMATPEMVSYFAEQLSEQTSRGVRNSVTDVRLEQGDLAEAWAEDGREYATVAMRFSMLDVTRDAMGRIVAGSDAVRSMATELWTFLRAPGGRWILSAIQQAA